MKGQSEFMEVLIPILMTVGLFAILIIVGPSLVGEMAKQLAIAGSDAVSREVAGMISISGASTGEIDIFWQSPSEKTSYNIKIENKKVGVDMLDEKKETINSAFSKTLFNTKADFKDIQSLSIIEKIIQSIPTVGMGKIYEVNVKVS